jgi:hypothetical protein
MAGPADHRAQGSRESSSFDGTDADKRRFFSRVYRELENRIRIFSELPIEILDGSTLKQRVEEIGKIKLPEAGESDSGDRPRPGVPRQEAHECAGPSR